jgi:hypothetical protein
MMPAAKLWGSAALGITLALSGLWLRAQQEQTRALSSLVPPGALLYLEAKNFRNLLNEWNLSAEKKNWVASANFGVLSRSRLVQRLGQAQDEFGSVTGLPIQFNLLNEVAGDRAAFAFYELSNLKFVYIARLDSSRLDTNRLWRTRARYEPRQAAGIPFYVKSDPATRRSVAFTHYQNWFIAASTEDRMAQTLALLSRAKAASLNNEPWFSSAVKRSSAQGDLRLVYNLDALLPTPQFRTYWIQRNTSELKAFTSGIADLFQRQNGFEEQRTLVRRQGTPGLSPERSIGEVLHYVPPASSLYRAWSLPDRSLVAEILRQVVFASPAGEQSLDRLAPQVSAQGSQAGLGSDFETRIDEPPLRRAEAASITQLANAVTGMRPTALVHIQATSLLGDDVFVMPESAAVIECQHADRAVLADSLRASTTILQNGSLDPLNVSVSGNTIIFSRLKIARSDTAPQYPSGTTYAAVFDKYLEWPHYKRLFGVIDRNPMNPEAPPAPNAPTFFSGNLGSLGDTLSRLQRASIAAQETATETRETIHHEMSPQ